MFRPPKNIQPRYQLKIIYFLVTLTSEMWGWTHDGVTPTHHTAIKTVNTIINILLTLFGLVVSVLTVKVPVVVGDVLVVVVLTPRLTGVEPITNLVVLVAVESLLPESEAVSSGKELATLNASEALKTSFLFWVALSLSLTTLCGMI